MNYRILENSIILSILGHLFLGIANIAILPPWEGFDETAHYSYLQYVADKKELPRQETARISKDIESYMLFGPLPYSSAAPMEKNGGFTYNSHFACCAGKFFCFSKMAEYKS